PKSKKAFTDTSAMGKYICIYWLSGCDVVPHLYRQQLSGDTVKPCDKSERFNWDTFGVIIKRTSCGGWVLQRR
ncbi:MAG: hypothetical protein ACU0CA_13110, partial [Paracoccaceae bacterium]